MTYPTSKSMLTFNIERKMPTDEEWLQLRPAGVLCMNTEQADHLWDLFDGDIDIYLRKHPDDGRSDPERGIDPVEWAKACVRRTGYNKNYWYVLENEPDDELWTVLWEIEGGQWLVDNGFKCIVGTFGTGSPARQLYPGGPVDWFGHLGDLAQFCVDNKGSIRMGLHEYADRHNYLYSFGWYIGRHNYLLEHFPDIEIAFLEFGFDNGDLDNSFFAGWRSGMSADAAADQIIEMVEKVYFPNVKNVKTLCLFQNGSTNSLWTNFDFGAMPFEIQKRMFDAARYDNVPDQSNDNAEPEAPMPDPVPDPEVYEPKLVKVITETVLNVRKQPSADGEWLDALEPGEHTMDVAAERVERDGYNWFSHKGIGVKAWSALGKIDGSEVYAEIGPVPVADPVVDDPVDMPQYVTVEQAQAMIDEAVRAVVSPSHLSLLMALRSWSKTCADAHWRMANAYNELTGYCTEELVANGVTFE